MFDIKHSKRENIVRYWKNIAPKLFLAFLLFTNKINNLNEYNINEYKLKKILITPL